MSRFQDALEAWHGTHADNIEKFDNDKVGSGEGAQVYGWGHYAGEARGTGEEYMQSVSRKRLGSSDGGYFFDRDPKDYDPIRFGQLADYGFSIQRGDIYSRQKLDRVLEQIREHNNLPRLLPGAKRHLLSMIQSAHDMYADQGPDLESQVDYAKDMYDEMLADGYDPDDEDHVEAKEYVDHHHAVLEKWAKAAKESSGGRLYELKIHTGDHELLHWDKPMKEQHPEVQEKMKPFIGAILSGTNSRFQNAYHNIIQGDEKLRNGDLTGGEVYKILPRVYGDARDASEALLKGGIHGIKYYDQFSRGRLKPTVYLDGQKVDDPAHLTNREDFAALRDFGVRAGYGYDTVDKLRKHYSETISEHTHAAVDPDDPSLGTLGPPDDSHYAVKALKWLDKNEHRLKIEPGKPTHNYVVFDPDLIKIVRKYDSRGNVLHDYTQAHGTELKPVDHDPFKEK